MKANKAPEKLYLLSNGLISYCRNTNEDIEYTSTDAFIEKAWDWIEDNLLSSNQQDKSRLYFEQFQNYMKEE